MTRRLYLLAFLLLAVFIIWSASSSFQRQETPSLADQPAAAGAGDVFFPRPSDADREREQINVQKETGAWIRKMEKLEEEKSLRARAESKTDQTRGLLQRDKRDAWTALLATNRQAFLALRDTARRSTNGETACEICDGRGSLTFCVLCTHNDGKCPTCGGTGHLSVTELCPTCVGSGKCYLCRGSGRMMCPFCNDGLIRRGQPDPPPTLPNR
jgi:hypothetical protein